MEDTGRDGYSEAPDNTKNLYDNNAAYVRMENEMSNTFNISKGVRQGCTQPYASTSMR